VQGNAVRRQKWYLGLCLVLFSTGCGSSPSGTVVPGVAVNPDPTSAPVTTPIPTPSPIPAPTPTPTPTPVPTPTPTPVVPTPSPTTFSASLNASSVFIGASIIQRWPLPLHNKGISGQTSAQVLQRFQSDVVGHGYVRVIIQVGSNDILQRVKDPPSTVSANIASMAQIARAANIDVVLMSLATITYNGVNYDSGAAAVNAQTRQLATNQGYPYLDIYTPMQGHPEYFVDGLHPTAAGYAVMEKVLAQTVTK
jgi:lysophospholipase L1-like esterase